LVPVKVLPPVAVAGSNAMSLPLMLPGGGRQNCRRAVAGTVGRSGWLLVGNVRRKPAKPWWGPKNFERAIWNIIHGACQQ